MRKIIYKFTVYAALLGVLINNCAILVLAQEVTVEPSPTVTETAVAAVVPTIEATPTAEVTPTTIPTTLPTPILDTSINTIQESQANTGSNSITGSPSSQTQIDSGDATVNQTGPENQNSTNNQAVGVTNQVNTNATSGNNQVTDSQSKMSVIATGDAVAFVNLVNFLNSNIKDSGVKISIIDLSKQSGDTNLNQTWQDFVAQNGATTIEPSNMQVINGGYNAADNQVNVAAVSGQNQATNNGGMVVIQTGNATALANIINLINTNLVASKYMISIVNIGDLYQGNIILPRPDSFVGQPNPEVNGTNNGVSMVTSSVAANANSGNNQTSSQDSSLMTTGVAISVVNNQTVVNATINGNQFRLIINNLGDWKGTVWGWDAANNQQTMVGIYGDLKTGKSSDGNEVVFVNNGVSVLNNVVTVSAVSGQNQTLGDLGSAITTGKSVAVANLFNFVNYNYYNSNNFFGVLNVLGKWNGNIVFAYPDMTVALKPVDGQEDTYQIDYKNLGYDTAKNVVIQLNMPAEINLEGKHEYQWQMGNVEAGSGGYIDLKLSSEKQTALRSLIKQVLAAEDQMQLPIKVKIFTADPELDTNNNEASTWVTVRNVAKEPSENTTTTIQTSGNQSDDILPTTEVGLSNNVNDFVYPGDTVTFEATIKNTNSIKSKDNYLEHRIYDKYGNLVLQSEIELGEIQANESFKLNYGIELPADYFTASGRYQSVAYVTGKTMRDNEYSSGSGNTWFTIKVKYTSMWKGSTGKTPQTPAQILGVSEAVKAMTENNAPILWPYLTLMMSSALWLLINTRKKALLLSSWKRLGLFIVMLSVFGFASVSVFRAEKGLNARWQYFSQALGISN